jgi:hypothetical protein
MAKRKSFRLIIADMPDRQAVAGILVKNGYSVTPGRQYKNESKRSYDYYIEVTDTMGREVTNAANDGNSGNTQE